MFFDIKDSEAARQTFNHVTNIEDTGLGEVVNIDDDKRRGTC